MTLGQLRKIIREVLDGSMRGSLRFGVPSNLRYDATVINRGDSLERDIEDEEDEDEPV